MRLADFLAAQRDALVERFKQRVAKTLAPEGLGEAELVDHLPDFLDALVQALREDLYPPSRVFSRNATAEQHGRQRLRVGFDLDAVTREYGLLRDCVFEMLEGADWTPTLRELRIFSDCVSAATADSVTQYVRHQQGLLQASEQRLQAVIDNAPAAVYVKDLEGRWLVVNRRMEALFGRPRAELLGQRDEDVLGPESAARIRANDEQVLKGNAPLDFEEVVSVGGRPRSFLSLKFPLRDERGRATAVCGISTDITERKRDEAALRESEERFRLLVEGVADYALFMLDPEGRVVSWNPGAERIHGYGSDEVLGRPLATFYTPEDVAAQVPAECLRQATVEGRHRAEGPRVRKDGSRFWADVVLTALRDEAGTLRGFAAVTHDTTERRRAELALRETGERLKAILDTAVDGIITIDERGIMQSVNAATTRLLGYAPEEMLGRNVSMLMPQPDRGRHDGYMENYLRTGVRKVIGIGREVLGQRKDGSVVPMELTVSETRLPGGRLFTGMLRDISKRKTAEQAQALLVEAGTVLAQSLDVPTTVRNLATLAVTHLADYCMVDLLDEHGQLQRLEVLARDPARQELVQGAAAYPPVVGSASPGARVVATGRTFASEVTPALGDAVVRGAAHRAVLEPLAARSSAIIPLIARGRTLGVMTLLSIEPGRMTSPSTLVLAEAVADRAAIAIDNARLYREAQEAVRVREDVVAIVSHDLRTPLNAISLAVSALLKREDLDARTTKTASRIYSAADRANRMIRDLLDFTQARAGGGIPIRPAPVDLHRLTRQVVEEVRLARPERPIHLVSRGDGRGAWDEDRLAQVIANLVGNALQHSPAESSVKVATREEDGGVAIEVHNEGTPIPTELLPMLFEPYRRGADAAMETGSMGLGLFITRQIVLGHGGRIEVHSVEGKGTTFTVRLPRQAPAPPASGG